MNKDLSKIAHQKKIKYFLISFVDLFGIQRAKLVPTRAISEMQKTGAGFGGFATYLDLDYDAPDMFALPDPDSLIQLPWQQEVGWLAADLVINGQPMEQCPRVMLKKQISKLKDSDLYMHSGVECEFFLITEDGMQIYDSRDTASKPCYDVSALMRRYDILKEISEAMIKLGWAPYQNDHEDANGQFEMNWDYSDCLTTADRHVFFKFMVKSIAENHGLRATFMPKPFDNLTGNGCHAHISVWTKNKKKNIFLNTKDELGLSRKGYNFIGGIMKSVDEFSAWLTPTINSFDRLNARMTDSGSTYSPTAITYSGNNRTHMIRIPDKGRFEFRVADGAVNPYLLQASLAAMGNYGMEKNIWPGKRIDINMYTEGKNLKDMRKLPNNLQNALELLKSGKLPKKVFGEAIINSYDKLKKREIKEYQNTSNSLKKNWARENVIDC